jgi:hypothetical protein
VKTAGALAEISYCRAAGWSRRKQDSRRSCGTCWVVLPKQREQGDASACETLKTQVPERGVTQRRIEDEPLASVGLRSDALQ